MTHCDMDVNGLILLGWVRPEPHLIIDMYEGLR